MKATIRERTGQSGTWYEADFVRLWKDDEKGEWRESRSFRDQNLEDLAKAVAEAHNWMVQKGTE